MKPTVALSLICFFLTPSHAIGQTSRADSLRSEIKEAGNDTSAVSLLLKLAAEYGENEPDSAISIYSRAIQLAEVLDFRPGLAQAYGDRGSIYAGIGVVDKELRPILCTGSSAKGLS